MKGISLGDTYDHLISPRMALFTAIGALSVLLGSAVALLPPYIAPIALLLAVIFVTLLVKMELWLAVIAFAAPSVHLILSFGDYSKSVLVLDRYHLLFIDLVSFTLLICIFIGSCRGRIKWTHGRQFVLPVFMFLSYAMTTSIWSVSPWSSAAVSAHMLSCAILFLAPMALVKSSDTLRPFLWVWVIVGVYAGVSGLITLYTDIEGLFYKWYTQLGQINFHYVMFGNIKNRAGGFCDPNRMALILNNAVFMGIALFLITQDKIKKTIIASMTLFTFYVMVHTLSKGGIGSFTVAILFFIFLNPKIKIKTLAAVSYGATFLLAFSIMANIDLGGGLGRLGSSPVETRGMSSLAQRLDWWTADLDTLVKNDFMGGGIGGMLTEWMYAQSSYFSLVTDLGLVGVSLAFLLCVIYATSMFKLMKKIYGDNEYYTLALAFLSCIVVFMVHSLVDFGYNFRLPWLMGGMAFIVASLGAVALEKKEDGKA